MARTARKRFHRRPPSRRARRFVATAVLAVLVANAIALVNWSSPDEERHREVAAAAVALAASADAVEVDLDPLAGITFAQVPVPLAVDPTATLPVPQAPPRNSHAPTPEIRHGQLEIPAIGLSQPFFEGITLTAINRGPSHWPGTAMPGQLGNVVIAGHRTTYTRPFWDLQALVPGDELIFTMNDGQRFVYELTSTEVVFPDDVHIVEQSHDFTATLFGCHPRGSARQRIVGHFRMKPDTVEVRLPRLMPPNAG